jgi:hypothetical protein
LGSYNSELGAAIAFDIAFVEIRGGDAPNGSKYSEAADAGAVASVRAALPAICKSVMNQYGRGIVAARVAAERAARGGGDGACALSSGAGAPSLCAAGASAGGAGGAGGGARSVAAAVGALLGAAAFASAIGGQCCGGTCEFFSVGCTSLRCMVGATGVSSAAGAGGGDARDAAATATARRTDGGDARDDSDAEVEDGGGYDSGSDNIMADMEDGAGEDSGGGGGDGGGAAAAWWLCGVDPDRARPFEEARARKDASQAAAFAALSPQTGRRAAGHFRFCKGLTVLART